MRYQPDHILFQEDIEKFQEKIPELKKFSQMMIAKLYRMYSQETYCAGWLAIDAHDKVIEDFREWLLVPNIKRLTKGD